MKTPINYLLLVFVFIISCNNDEIDRDGTGNSNWGEAIKESKRLIENKFSRKDTYQGVDLNSLKYRSEVDTNVYVKDYFLENSTKYKFSNKETYDDFKLTVKGKKIYYSTIEFTITNSNGQTIFYDKFPLLKVIEKVFDGGGEYATFIQQDDYIRNWVDNFFNNEKFITPAIHAERPFEAMFSKKQNWDAIAANPDAVGFSYSKSRDSQTEIAFDKTQNKVIEYYDY